MQERSNRFLEPACGNGNFLIAVLRYKLADVQCRCGNNRTEYERSAVIAVASLRGIDILENNVLECRQRLFDFIQAEYEQLFGKQPDDNYLDSIRAVLEQNIICGNALTLFADEEYTTRSLNLDSC
ncbi:hypothetical protein FACS1894170_05600 [Planctomycetales bacterium]|nr:hypothetical protein FACS1894170_05600 [Planctomycetales bacterium]